MSALGEGDAAAVVGRVAALALWRYALLGALALAAYAIGRRITRRLVFHSAWEEASLCTALGLGAIAYLVFFLGLAHRIDRPSFLLAMAALVAISWREVARAARAALGAVRRQGRAESAGHPASGERADSSGRPARGRAIAIAVAALFLLAPVFLLPLYPPIAWDAIAYHLPYAKACAESGTLALNPYLHFPVLPQVAEMLFAAALLVGDDLLAQLTQFLYLTLLTIGCVAFGRRHFSQRAGLWGAALLVGNSQVIWLSSIGYVDIGLAAYVTLGFFAFWTWRESGERGWLLLAGAFCGLAAGTKYLGLFAATIVLLAVLATPGRGRRLTNALAFGALAAAVASPSYVRNALLTGNPVFPFLGRIFGYSYWSAADVRWAHDDVIAQHGVGRGLLSLLTLPWHLVANQVVLDAEERISPLYGLTIPIMVVVGLRWRRIGFLYALGLAYVVAWFFSAQLLRYLIPALPVMGVAMAAALDRALPAALPAAPRAAPPASATSPETSPPRPPLLARLVRRVPLATPLVALVLASPGIWFALRTMREWGLPPTSAAARDRHIVRYRPSYPAYEFLNATRGADYAVYAYHEWCMTYFADGVFMGAWVGPARYADIEPHWDDGEALYTALRRLGATHFLISSWYGKVRVPSNKAFHERFRLVFAKANVVLFELSDVSLRRVVGANRIENPGFETLSDGWPQAWQATGRPLVGAGGESGGSGGAVRCSGDQESVFQAVPVTPGEQCLFHYRSCTEGPAQRGRLAILWFDAAGKAIGSDIEVNAVTGEWRVYRMLVTVPEGAAYANVCAVPDAGATLWFDDVFFADVSYHATS